jgi:hypothetical protein
MARTTEDKRPSLVSEARCGHLIHAGPRSATRLLAALLVKDIRPPFNRERAAEAERQQKTQEFMPGDLSRRCLIPEHARSTAGPPLYRCG